MFLELTLANELPIVINTDHIKTFIGFTDEIELGINTRILMKDNVPVHVREEPIEIKIIMERGGIAVQGAEE